MAQRIDSNAVTPKPYYQYARAMAEYRANILDLSLFVDERIVEAKTGAQNYTKRSDLNGLELTEDDRSFNYIDDSINTVEYALKRRAGAMIVSSEFEEDMPGVKKEVDRFASVQSIVTKDKAILALLQEGEAAAFADFEAVKNAAVGLGVYHLPFTYIITNENGLKKFAAVTDGTGASVVKCGDKGSRPYVEVMGYRVPVLAADNKILPDGDNGKSPVIVSDLSEAVALFSAPTMNVYRVEAGQVTDQDGNVSDLFTTARVAFKLVVEFDAKAKDTSASVNGYL